MVYHLTFFLWMQMIFPINLLFNAANNDIWYCLWCKYPVCPSLPVFVSADIWSRTERVTPSARKLRFFAYENNCLLKVVAYHDKILFLISLIKYTVGCNNLKFNQLSLLFITCVPKTSNMATNVAHLKQKLKTYHNYCFKNMVLIIWYFRLKSVIRSTFSTS